MLSSNAQHCPEHSLVEDTLTRYVYALIYLYDNNVPFT